MLAFKRLPHLEMICTHVRGEKNMLSCDSGGLIAQIQSMHYEWHILH